MPAAAHADAMWAAWTSDPPASGSSRSRQAIMCTRSSPAEAAISARGTSNRTTGGAGAAGAWGASWVAARCAAVSVTIEERRRARRGVSAIDGNPEGARRGRSWHVGVQQGEQGIALEGGGAERQPRALEPRLPEQGGEGEHEGERAEGVALERIEVLGRERHGEHRDREHAVGRRPAPEGDDRQDEERQR